MDAIPKIFGKWPKNELIKWNAQIALNPVKNTEYKNEYLAKYLKTKYPTVTFPKTFEGESGTISSRYKVKLAQHIGKTITWSDMSPESKTLAKSVFEFIVKHNPLLARLL